MITSTRPFLIGLFLVAALSACGSDDEGGSETTAAAAATTAAPATAAPATAAATTEAPASTAAATTAAPATTEAAATTAAESAEAVIAVGTSADWGDIVVDRAGFSLYIFATDTSTSSTCTGGCVQAWPPVIVDGEPEVGDGLDPALVGTITRDDGTTQISYDGHPLYRFASDIAPGDTNGHGVGDVWYLINPEGSIISA